VNTMSREHEPSSVQPGKAVRERAAEWVVRLNDAAVSEADFLAWQAWLAESPAHARAFQELQDTWRRSACVSQVSSASAAALEDMREEIDALCEPSTRERTFALRSVAIAAMAVIAVVGVLVWRHGPETVATTTAELRSVRLPDGSRAALGPETRLELDFSDTARSLAMPTGEAYFEVVHAPERPFSVNTPAGRIVAVGTAFSVHATSDRVAVSVTEGSVRVEPPGNPDPASAVVVAAGQRFVRDHASVDIEPLVSAADAVAWRQGRLEYQGEPLRVVVSDINRYSPVKLHIADPAVGELRYTGTVFPDALDAWVASIEGVFPVRIEALDGERLIVRAESDRPD
jgi:transmembrane sensor